MNIFQETYDEYCRQVGHTPEKNRLRHNVEMRAAFANGVHAFFHHADIASVFQLDRTSVYHYVRSHETYYMSSPDYRKWFSIASEIVEDKVDKRVPLQVRTQIKKKRDTHEQIDTIKRTINILEKFLERFQSKLTGRKAGSLQDSREGGLRDDDGHLGDGEVHSLLRDEQFQVSNESRKEEGAIIGNRHSESTVV